ncbi:hypothetical protein AB4Y38_24600 [Paraburkholderia sp. EG285A]|uniref:hypothetical protein n=1 Tax=Paraburkholderia sp. EG285A TaxID=3237009 RepID=UPI0034D1A3FE
MSRAGNIDLIESRDKVRERAFDLAESGSFADWAAVRLALSEECPPEYLNHVFASAFCRLDLNQRCRSARMGSPRSDTSPGRVLPGFRRTRRRNPSPANKSTKFADLARDIAAALDGANPRTAVDIATQLGAEARNVRRALRVMLAEGEVHVAGRVPPSGGGATARLFGPGRVAARDGNAAENAARILATLDPVVLDAMDAFARHA